MSDSPEVRDLLEESTDEEPQRREENYHQEIDDIVKGFILEKDILKQGHDDELTHMKQQFRKERSSLMKQFEKERQEMLRNTNRENLTSEARYTSSSTDSALGYSCSHNHSTPDAVFESQWEQLSPSTRRVIKEPEAMDLNVIREIAEVYLRMQNGLVTSSVRPDLDLEDKFEREREVLEQSFIVEKRELRRKFEEDFNRKLEQERNRYECTIQDQKTMISDLQWQKRELENRLRHDREKIEIQFEREKNEIEKHRMQDVQDLQRKIEIKYSTEMAKQRDKYEENINELQGDITRLTMQLRELNENLKQEKEIIVTKFEREIKEMEIAFTEQRASIQISLESEFSIKLENETTILRSMNNKLKDDLESLEKDKRDMERKLKEERRRLEEKYEDEISEMGQKYAEDRKSIKTRTEERYHQLLIKERGPLEENIIELQGDINILRHENTHLEAAMNERTEEMRKQIDFEREEVRRKLYSDREEIRARIESEFSQKLIIETSSQQEIAKNQEIELSTLRARCLELEGRISLFIQEKDTLMREREQVENNIRMREMELNSRQELLTSQRNACNKDELDDIISKKDSEISTLNLEKERLEIKLSALKREKMDFEDQIVSLKRAQNINATSSSGERTEKSGRNVLDNSELASLQETIRKNEKEMHSLKREKYDFESRLSSMQRKIEELEDELLTLRRKKLEVEDEISALKRDKTETDDQLTGMRREKVDLEEQLSSLKRKLNESEDEVSAFKRGKMELDHEIAMLKRYSNNAEKQTSVTQHHQHVTKHVRFEDPHHVHHDDHVTPSRQGWEADELEEKINRLIGEKQVLENEIHKLKREKTEVERDLRSRLEHRQETLQETTEKRREQDDQKRQQDEKEKKWVFEQQTHEFEYKITSLKEEQMELQYKISHLRRDVAGLEERASSLGREKCDLEKAISPLRFEKHDLEKTIESFQREKKSFENKMVDTKLSQDNFHENSKDDEISRIRQQREDLKIELSNLKKQLVILQSELSSKSVHISKESVRIEEKEITEMKRDRMELEKVVAALRRQKTELETEITVIRDVKKREETDITTLRKEKMELDMLLTGLQSQKTRLQAEASVIRETRKREENEINSLRKEKNDIEKQLYTLQSQQWKLEADISVADDSWRKKGSAITGLSTDIVGVEEQLTTLRKQKSELQHEISKIQSAKNREEKELITIRQERGTYNSSLDVREEQQQLDLLRKQREDLQVEITTIQRERKREEKELALIRNEKFEIESTLLSLRKEIDHCDSFSTDFPSSSTPRFPLSQAESSSRSCNCKCETSSRYYSSDLDTLSRIGPSLSNESSPRLSSSFLNSSSRTQTSNSKENNELKYLSDEKSHLQTQICNLRVQLSRLQTEVTEMENKKITLDSVHGGHSEFLLANGTESTSFNGVHSHRGSEDSLREDLKEELSKAIKEEKKDSLIQGYENRIKELKEKNLELKRKVGLLEWQVENMKQKIEIQEVSHRREISALKEKHLTSTISSNSMRSDSIHLRSLYSRLSHMVEGKRATTEDIMRELRTEIRNFEHKLPVDDKNLSQRGRNELSLSTKLDKESGSVTRDAKAARDYASQLRKQLETADDQLKNCEKIIHRLYNENSELNKSVSNMDNKLKHATRSEEKLQRKKVLLQKLVDKLSGHLGKELLQQSYLVLELDKDIVS